MKDISVGLHYTKHVRQNGNDDDNKGDGDEHNDNKCTKKLRRNMLTGKLQLHC